ncbi:MAG: tRNA (adenosine(37)-N6)-threonylcarbamoyltransferase complex dimerization subunit type 1 TsaB, partial [Ruminococcus sp.]|nr:tRNA (adenosine(37)-N6)-threonylcarbamoyltransferase complex dimerization subunit type 1 TsaB [Ruminococcus sp.]
MMILSVDSSATPASVCLYDGKVLAEYYINTKLTHSQTLVAMIESVLQVTGTDVKDIDMYAVNSGPGSFTGVRIGVSAVKGMAYAQDKPCVAVSTLHSMAYLDLS